MDLMEIQDANGKGIMRLTSEGTLTWNGFEWVEGFGRVDVDAEAAFRAAWRAWNEATQHLDFMPGHGEDIDMMKRAARERGLD